MQRRSLVLALLPCLWLVAGCGQSERSVYIKPDVTDAQRKQDQADCVRSSIDITEAERSLFAVVPINREDFNKCMEARGYSAASRR